MTALSADATSMAGFLTALTQPDTEAIRQAEIALKPILKDPRSVPALVEILKARETQVCHSYITIQFCRKMKNGWPTVFLKLWFFSSRFALTLFLSMII